MKSDYKIMMHNTQVGTASITKQGLYWVINCCCQLPDNKMHRVCMKTEDAEIDMGILVPNDHCFYLIHRVAMKKAGKGEPQFFIKEEIHEVAASFQPILQDEPFVAIERLKDSHLVVVEDQPGIMLDQEDPASETQDNDQILEYPDE